MLYLGLRFRSLDLGLELDALLEGVFGSKRWMSMLAKKAGSTRSKAKAAAARANGAKGGRPPLSAAEKKRRARKRSTVEKH